MGNKETKILMMTGFSSGEVRSHFTYKRNGLFLKTALKILKLPLRVIKSQDAAPWAGRLIAALEKRDDIDLHVVMAEVRLSQSIERFKLRGVNYYAFRSDFTGLTRKINNYNLWLKLQQSGRYFRKIVDEVKPDIIIVCGAENPVSSVTALYGEDYPVWCLCQTMYFNPERKKYSVPNKLNLAVEEAIHRKLTYFGVNCKLHHDLLRTRRHDATIIEFHWPPEPTAPVNVIPKIYDFINFSFNMGDRKGDVDSIKALAIVKKKYPKVKLNIAGGLSAERKSCLLQLISELHLNENVSFTPFFEKKIDMMQHIVQSRFAVLPTKLDSIAGTITESMAYGLPVVTYKTTGTPNLNKDAECVLIVEKNDIEDLASKMLELMENEKLADELRSESLEFIKKRVESTINIDNFVEACKAIVSNYHQQVPINDNLLFKNK